MSYYLFKDQKTEVETVKVLPYLKAALLPTQGVSLTTAQVSYGQTEHLIMWSITMVLNLGCLEACETLEDTWVCAWYLKRFH